MTSLKAILLTCALSAASAGAVAMPAMADTATADPTQVTTLVTNIEGAINGLPAGSTVSAIEAAINGQIATGGFSTSVVQAALVLVEKDEAGGSNAALAVATLESNGGGTTIPGAGGQGGASPIGSPVVGSSGGSATVP